MDNSQDSAFTRRFMLLAGAGVSLATALMSSPRRGLAMPAKASESSPFGGHVHALAVNPKTKELFLGARPIYRSSDRGKSWRVIEDIPKTEERANITSIAINPQDPRIMYATGHGIGVVKSTDGGRTWNRAVSGLGGASTEAIAIAVNDPNTLYTWVLETGLYRSKDAAASWQRVDDGPKGQEIRSLASVGAPSGMGGIWLYAGTDVGVIKSPDCFCGWDRLGNVGLPQNARVYSLAADPTTPSIVYAGLRHGVFKTTDGGKTWSHVTDLVEDAIVAVDLSTPSAVYAMGSDGILISSGDAGATWRKGA